MIEQQQARGIGEVLLNDPTVRVARGFGNFQEVYIVRGFPIFSDDISYNGLYGLLPRQYVATEFVERVEVIRGANSFLNGAAPSGSGIGGERDDIFWGSFEGQSSFRSQHHSTVAFDAQTGTYVNYNRIDDASVWKQVHDAFEPLHYGTVGGLFTRILWCACGFAPGFLALSGFYIRWKRR